MTLGANFSSFCVIFMARVRRRASGYFLILPSGPYVPDGGRGVGGTRTAAGSAGGVGLG